MGCPALVLAALCAAWLTAQSAAPPGSHDAVAQVGDRVISLSDVDREWQRTDPDGYDKVMRGATPSSVDWTRTERAYEARSRVLESIVSNEIFAREARRRGLTVDELLAQELPGRTPKPDKVEGGEIRFYRATHPANKDQTDAELRAILESRSKNRAEARAKWRYVQELGATETRVRWMLEAPRFTIPVSDSDPARGFADAPVRVVVFGDLRSPEYRQVWLLLAATPDMIKRQLRIVFKSMTAPGSPKPPLVAEAAACAHAQGHFWEYHDRIVQHPFDALNILEDDAAAIGLDRTKFDQCVRLARFQTQIEETGRQAESHGLAAGAVAFVNGRMVLDPLDRDGNASLMNIIEDEIQRTSGRAPARR